MRQVFILLLIIICFRSGYSDTLVVFLPSPDETHRDLFGTYYHTAIRVQGDWWESHPYHGVHRNNRQISRYLELPGARVLRSPKSMAAPMPSVLLDLQGTPFDLHSEWGDLTSLNCTELVAHVLNLNHYAVPITEEGFRIGELGLSPDRLYDKLLEDGWQNALTHSKVCQDALLY